MSTVIPYPEWAPAHRQPIVVRASLLVGVDGLVREARLLSSPQLVFDHAVLAAVRKFRFSAARFDGKPVQVRIAFTQRFLPPSATVAPRRKIDERVSRLRGELREMGTSKRIGYGQVSVTVGRRHYTTSSDAKGAFELLLPAGSVQVQVLSSPHRLFIQRERLLSRQDLEVVYYLSRLSHDPYHTVVRGERRREVTRIALRGRELTQVPGTFGDPFRVIQTLPGTASVVSLLPFAVVRGATPSSTGFLLDRTPVPLLYHLLAGPSVIHPEFVHEVEFLPGGAPVTFGGYVGGIVNGKTRRARGKERVFDLDVNLAQSGLLVRLPVEQLDLTVSAAARYGYPGFLMSLATDEASLSYWDYQFRIDGGNRRRGYTIFAFGARDALETRDDEIYDGERGYSQRSNELTPALTLHFHRLALSAYHRSQRLTGRYRLVLGFDESFTRESNVSTFVMRPEIRLSYRIGDTLSLHAGLQGQLSAYDHESPILEPGEGNEEFDLRDFIEDLNLLYSGGLYVEALWRPSTRWLIRPGLRGDIYFDGQTTKGGLNPRLTMRYHLLRRIWRDEVRAEQSGLWLKGALGLYQQPPRYVLPLPGLNTMPLNYGLMRALQASLGLEMPFPKGVTLSAEGFFNYIDPTLFDFTLNVSDAEEFLHRLKQKGKGRAYGLELMIRRRAKDGVYGWLAYTFSRAGRRFENRWVPYDFDRTHLLNLVLGVVLPRNWSVGGRLQYQSGRPLSSKNGFNDKRGVGFVRIDVRVDKRAVWRGWMLDFYVDLLNVALLPEELEDGFPLRYVIPTAGLRARF